MIFQPYIDKEYELRIIYIDGEFFTGMINNSENADWRIAREDTSGPPMNCLMTL
jgi:hypothetical protein